MFTGMGPSKSIAKNICAEQVTSYVFEQPTPCWHICLVFVCVCICTCVYLQVLQYITTKSCAGNKTEAEGEDLLEEEGDQENGGKITGRPDMETDTPWVSLASLALFKLFNDWQAQVMHLHRHLHLLLPYIISPGLRDAPRHNAREPQHGTP